MTANEEKSVKIFTLERAHEYLVPLIEDTFKNVGIDFRVRSKFDTAYDGVFIGQKGLGDIYVFEKDRVKAEEILQHIVEENPGE